MAKYASQEYGEIIRVHPTYDDEILRRDGYSYVSEAKPLAARQYCREMTLARGRILYEVWDPWSNHHLGYIVPSEILHEAKAYRPNGTLTPWLEEPSRTRQVLQNAHSMVLEQSPRIPLYSAKMIADTFRTCRSRFLKREIEEAVVRHARERYTSYEFRVREMRQAEDAVEQVVRERLRAVLRGWLERDAAGREVVGLWERHGLLDEGEEVVVLKGLEVMYYGGSETPLNLVKVARARL